MAKGRKLENTQGFERPIKKEYGIARKKYIFGWKEISLPWL